MSESDEKDYSRYLTKTAQSRQESAIRRLIPLLRIPDIISFGAGLPNPSRFPFSGIGFQLKDGTKFNFTEDELNQALQYSSTAGLPSFVEILRDIQKREHNPCYKNDSDWSILVGTGSQDLLTKAFELFTDEEDYILVESPTYGGAMSFLIPRRNRLLCIDCDEDGLKPDSLRKILRSFEGKTDKPKVLYTVPTGQNPSGSTLSDERRIEIYKIACEYDLIIMEDDPYWFLNFGPGPAPQNDADYQRPKLRSLFSMDTEHRVIRFDSLSKTISSGLRVGFVTGATPLIKRLVYHGQATFLHTSGVSQMMMAKLLKHWKYEGFVEHCIKCQLFYKRRRDIALKAVQKYLTGLAEWTTPVAGMFLWIKLLGIPDTDALLAEAVSEKVLFVPGKAFMADRDTPCEYIRASYSLANDEQTDVGYQRLGKLLRRLKSSNL